MSEWEKIPDFPVYSVSDDGLIRNDETERILRRVKHHDGRMMIGLMRNRTQYTRAVSRLVMAVFVPNIDPYRSDTPIHLDGDLSNCAAYNLTWRPRWFAKDYTRQFRVGAPDTPAIRNLDTGETYSGVWELVMKYGLLRSDIMECLGRDWPVYPIMQRFDWLD
jgi:hypothetical protein